MWKFKNNGIGLKINCGSPPRCSCLRNVYYVITFCCFTQVFVDLAYKQLTMVLSQAHNLLRHNNLLGNLTDDSVNNFMSFFESCYVYFTIVDETCSCRLLIMLGDGSVG